LICTNMDVSDYSSPTKRKSVSCNDLSSQFEDQVNISNSYHHIPFGVNTVKKDRSSPSSSSRHYHYITTPLANLGEEDTEMKYAEHTHNLLENSLRKARSSYLNPKVYSPDNTTPRNTPDQFEALVNSKDQLMRHKDDSIIKLRLKNQQLEHKLKEMQAGFGIDRSSEHNLRLLLGRTEQELMETRNQMEAGRNLAEERVKKYVRAAELRKLESQEAVGKVQYLQGQIARWRKRSSCLEKYLGELPTKVQVEQSENEAKQMAHEREKLVAEVEDLKLKIQICKQEGRERTNKLKQVLKKSLLEQERKQEQVEELGEQLTRLREMRTPMQAQERLEYQDLKIKYDDLKKEYIEMQLNLSSSAKITNQQTERNKKDLRKLEEKLKESKEENLNLKEEIRMKQSTNDKLNSAMVTFSSQNQNFMEENLTLQEKVKVLERKMSNQNENENLQGKLQQQLVSSMNEFKSIVQLVKQSMEGKDLDLSSLLRCSVDDVINETSNQRTGNDGSSTPDSGTSTADFNSAEICPAGGDLRGKIRQVRSMRREMDDIRRLIQRKYAEDIGTDGCVTH